MAEQARFEIRCGNEDCGKKVPFNNDADDKDMIVCPACGHDVATAGDLRKAAKRKITKPALSQLNKTIKKLNKRR